MLGSRTNAVQSFEAVINIDLSLLKLILLTLSVWHFRRVTSLHVSTSYLTILPVSKPAMMCWSAIVQPRHVALSLSSTDMVALAVWRGAGSDSLADTGAESHGSGCTGGIKSSKRR